MTWLISNNEIDIPILLMHSVIAQSSDRTFKSITHAVNKHNCLFTAQRQLHVQHIQSCECIVLLNVLQTTGMILPSECTVIIHSYHEMEALYNLLP